MAVCHLTCTAIYSSLATVDGQIKLKIFLTLQHECGRKREIKFREKNLFIDICAMQFWLQDKPEKKDKWPLHAFTLMQMRRWQKEATHWKQILFGCFLLVHRCRRVSDH